MNNPLVSILIPVYNRESILSETIESALSQTYSNIEIIIVDNCSTDDTWNIIQQYATKDKRIKPFRNDTNIGPVRNWLACLDQATGQFTKILWSDDLIHSQFLDRLLPFFKDPSIAFVYSGVNVFDNSPSTPNKTLYASMQDGVYETKSFIAGVLLGGDFPFSPGCAIFRTADVKKNLYLDIPNRVGSDFSMHAIGNDLLLFLLTAQQYPNYGYVNEPLAYFREHTDSITVTASGGKLLFHYDLVKGFFAEHYIKDKKLLRKLNSFFLIHLLKFDAKNYNIHRINDFYPTKKSNWISVQYLAGRLVDSWRKRYKLNNSSKGNS